MLEKKKGPKSLTKHFYLDKQEKEQIRPKVSRRKVITKRNQSTKQKKGKDY